MRLTSERLKNFTSVDIFSKIYKNLFDEDPKYVIFDNYLYNIEDEYARCFDRVRCQNYGANFNTIEKGIDTIAFPGLLKNNCLRVNCLPQLQTNPEEIIKTLIAARVNKLYNNSQSQSHRPDEYHVALDTFRQDFAFAIPAGIIPHGRYNKIKNFVFEPCFTTVLFDTKLHTVNDEKDSEIYLVRCSSAHIKAFSDELINLMFNQISAFNKQIKCPYNSFDVRTTLLNYVIAFDPNLYGIFLIYHKKTSELCGISYVLSRENINIIIFPQYRRKGYGSSALQYVLYGFTNETENANRFGGYFPTYSTNIPFGKWCPAELNTGEAALNFALKNGAIPLVDCFVAELSEQQIQHLTDIAALSK